MAIDPSIAAGQAPGSLLQTLAGATQLRGQMMQQRANTAMSDALQQSIDPNTGQPNIQKAMSLIAQSPDAAYNLPAFQSQMLQNQTQQVQFDKDKLELARNKSETFANGFGGLLSTQSFTPAAVYKLAANAVSQGLITPEEVVQFTSDMPTDSAQLPGWIQQKYLGFADNVEKLKTLQPQMQTINTGPQTVLAAFNPQTGAPTGQTTVFNNGMAPGDANSLVQVYNDKTGQMDFMTKAQAAQVANGMGQGAPQAGSTLGLPGTGSNGRYPGQGGQGQAPQGGGLHAGPAIGASAAADVLGKGAGESILKLQDTASGAPDRIRFLQDMTSNLNHFESGPTSNWTAQAKALALQLAPGMAAQVGVDPQAVASKEEFTKYAAQLAMSSMKGMGSGTDSQLATTVSGNPHAELSKLGLQQIMQVMTGVERANLAKNAAWQQAGRPPQEYGKWESTWNKDIDPRVFVTPEMSQPEVSKMYKALKPADQARFKTSLRTAIDAGIIPNPVGQ